MRALLLVTVLILGAAVYLSSTSRLDLQAAVELAILWLLCPIGISWSWPEGKEVFLLRFVLSASAIGAATAAAGWLFG